MPKRKNVTLRKGIGSDIYRSFVGQFTFLPRLAAVMLPLRVLSGSNRVELPTGGVELLKKILIETDFK